MEEIRVYIADASADFATLLTAALREREALQVIGSATDGETALREIAALAPDVLVSDILLPKLDGISLLRALNAEAQPPRVVVVSAFVNDRVAQTLSHLGVEAFFPKPCNPDTLVQQVLEAGRAAVGCEKDAAMMIREHLMNFPISSHLNGYLYLLEALRCVLYNRGSLQGVTKSLYRDLAKRFGTTDKCVERSMRSAIEKGWERGSLAHRHSYFNGVFDAFTRPPTNVQFLATMAEHIEMQTEPLGQAK